MSPNHGGDPVGSILGPMGSHWVQKMGRNRTKLPCPKIRIFDYPAVIDFLQKNGNYGFGAKSRWGPRGFYLGANGVQLGPKNGSKLYKITMPQNSYLRLPCGHRFFVNNGSYGYGDKSRWGPPRVHLAVNGVQLGRKKWGKNIKNYHAPKFAFSTTPRKWIFVKNGSYGNGAKSRWGSRGVYLGANGVPLGPKKWVKTVQNYQAPKFKFSTTLLSSIFPKKMEVMVIAPNHGGDSLGSIMGPMGPIGFKKWVKSIENYHAPKFEFSTTLRSSIFSKK